MSLKALQQKIGVTADGAWGPGTLRAAAAFYKLSPARAAHFFGQTSHETGGFKAFSENLNYGAKGLMGVFKKYFPDAATAAKYERKPEAIANRVYANRMGNGPESSGDGWKYRGRGALQLTGKDNYSWFAASIETPLEQIPEYLQTFEGAVQSACWFWETNNLNQWADAGDILTLTKRINGGTIGLDDRIKHYKHALHVLGGDSSDGASHVAESSGPDMSTVIRRGSKGATVAAVQAKLGLTADGDFGPGTERALMGWQRENGLEPDGIAGPLTLAKILG
jgi:putative chitinase